MTQKGEWEHFYLSDSLSVEVGKRLLCCIVSCCVCCGHVVSSSTVLIMFFRARSPRQVTNEAPLIRGEDLQSFDPWKGSPEFLFFVYIYFCKLFIPARTPRR